MQTEILSPSPESISRAMKTLRDGDLVAVPTETVYGLAGNLFNPDALAKIFAAKERPSFDPLISHVSTPNLDDLEKMELIDLKFFSKEAKKQIETLTQKFWPGPLTLVLPKNRKVPDLATSGLETVAVRMPNHPLTLSLIREAGFPLAAPSANRFGRISPTQAQHVSEELAGRIPLILDGGPCQVGIESTVLACNAAGEIKLLRPGGISVDQIEAALGIKVGAPELGVQAPGMLASHYAPRRPLFFMSNLPQIKSVLQIGYLSASGAIPMATDLLRKRFGNPKIEQKILSPSGDSIEAAKNLFAYLRELDSTESNMLVAEFWPTNEGLGYAINDRLKRAAGLG